MVNEKSVMTLLKAMTNLSNLMHQDGGFHKGGLKEYLSSYNCSYISDLAKYLKDKGYVGFDASGSHKTPKLFWNKHANPSVKLCVKITDEVRDIKRERDSKRPKVKNISLAVAYKGLQDEMTHHRSRLKELEIVAKYIFDILVIEGKDDK